MTLDVCQSTLRDPDRRVRLMGRFLAGFALLLLGVTWRLWTPQVVFPQIPFFHILVKTPPAVDWLLGAIVVVCLIGMLLATSSIPARRWSLLFAVFFCGLVLLDQHRLQPWAYQFVVFALLIATCRSRWALAWMRGIVISIYLYSAISKFDYQFIHTIGEQLLSTLVGFTGMESLTWPEHVRYWLIIAFPLGELLVGLGLAFSKTRQVAIFSAIGLHVTLLVTLGPWGMAHQPGVLVWNLFFVVQIVLLFGCLPNGHSLIDLSPQREIPVQDPVASASLLEFVGSLVAVSVILFPATHAIGVCDHWPAWEVYAPRSSRAEIVRPNPEIGSFSTDNLRLDQEPWLDISKWSLSELGVPVYPEARFQLAVALAVAEKFDLDREIQVELKSESNRRTGARTSERLSGRDQLAMRSRQFWLNTSVRTIWLEH